ncbi:hypothetical protein APA_1449 [Pseudanabaena sp. lw0831]|nr:hypothetical protein APA_1449 [Pseudanabaena sp. lw0831]
MELCQKSNTIFPQRIVAISARFIKYSYILLMLGQKQNPKESRGAKHRNSLLGFMS